MKKSVIVHGELQNGIQKKAIAVLSELLLDYTLEYPYCVECGKEKNYIGERLFYIGTRASSEAIGALASQKLTTPEEYRLTVKGGTVFIEGYDDVGVIYGCIDFFAKYIVRLEYPNDDRYRINCFEGELPDFEYSHAPSVRSRGFWTWGHVIYDYKAYIDNMMKLKLNTLTVWNDRVPVNAEELIDYAHNCGIKVIFGYSWLWGTDCTKIPFDRLCEYSEKIFEQYESEYSRLGADGIYFQSFTELQTDTVGDVVIADAVTDFVNKTAARFFEKYPKLELWFGLHATSVKDRLESIKATDRRIRIVWEDCGSFPFSYMPSDTDGFDSTCEFVKKIATLRGRDDLFGVVTKGLTKLDWSSFAHMNEPLCIGESSKELKANRVERKRKIWRYLQAYWMINADKALKAVQIMREEKKGDLCICALAEDGMIEENIMYPAALFAEMLWDSDADLRTLMTEVALRGYVDFA